VRNFLKRYFCKPSANFSLIYSQALVPRLLHQYDLFAVDGPAEVSVFADLSKLQPGDTVIFEEYLALDSEELLFNSTSILDKQLAPIFHFPSLHIPKRYRLKVAQTRGTPKEIKIFVYGR